MRPARWDLYCRKGATFQRQFTFKANGTAVNLTGYTARMKVKDLEDDTEIVSLTTENGRIALGGVAGTVDLTIAATDTDDLTEGCHKWDIELVSAGGIVYCPFEGTFEVAAEVTI